jgi:hypothetical protein
MRACHQAVGTPVRRNIRFSREIVGGAASLAALPNFIGGKYFADDQATCLTMSCPP